MTDNTDQHNQQSIKGQGDLVHRLVEINHVLDEVSAKCNIEPFTNIQPDESLILDMNSGEPLSRQDTQNCGFAFYNWYPERFDAESLKKLGIEYKTDYNIGVGNARYSKRIYGPIGIPLNKERILPGIMHEYGGSSTTYVFLVTTNYIVSVDGLLTFEQSKDPYTELRGLIRQNHVQNENTAFVRDFQGVVTPSNHPEFSLNIIKVHGSIDGQMDIPAKIYAEKADIDLKISAPLLVEISGLPESTEIIGVEKYQSQSDQSKIEICSLHGNIRLEYISN